MRWYAHRVPIYVAELKEHGRQSLFLESIPEKRPKNAGQPSPSNSRPGGFSFAACLPCDDHKLGHSLAGMDLSSLDEPALRSCSSSANGQKCPGAAWLVAAET